MNTEDDEFNRIEREAAMRKAAVHATVTKKEWIGLTDEEWISLGCKSVEEVRIGLAIEDALRRKNEM
jgi:hypothetical protein